MWNKKDGNLPLRLGKATKHSLLHDTTNGTAGLSRLNFVCGKGKTMAMLPMKPYPTCPACKTELFRNPDVEEPFFFEECVNCPIKFTQYGRDYDDPRKLFNFKYTLGRYQIDTFVQVNHTSISAWFPYQTLRIKPAYIPDFEDIPALEMKIKTWLTFS